MEEWIKRWQQFKEGSLGKLLFRVVKYAFLVGLIIYIIYQLKTIGVSEVLQNLPVNPLFYILFIFLYLSLPLWEIVIYRLFWKFRYVEGLRPFISKKIFNSEVVGYSGEIYLFSWAKKRFDLPNKQIYGPIKDNSILSSVVSTTTAVILLLIYANLTDLDFLQTIKISRNAVIGIFIGIFAILVVLFLFRKNVLSIDPTILWKVMLIHEARILCSYSIEVLQWSIIMPDVPFTVWFTLLAAKIITSRLPFIPNQDIIFAGIGIELSKVLNVSSAGIAGILLTNTVLLKLTNLVLYSAFQIRDQIKPERQTV